MRALVIDDDAKLRVAAVLLHAAQPAQHLRAGETHRSPGNDPRHVAQLDTYRCVFSYTRAGRLYRHLSVSVPAPGKLPSIAAVIVIAQLFGFVGDVDPDQVAGWPSSWLVAVHKDKPDCIGHVVVAQAIDDETEVA